MDKELKLVAEPNTNKVFNFVDSNLHLLVGVVWAERECAEYLVFCPEVEEHIARMNEHDKTDLEFLVTILERAAGNLRLAIETKNLPKRCLEIHSKGESKMKDSEGNKIRASGMTPEQAFDVLTRMFDRAKKKTYRRALEMALDWGSIVLNTAAGDEKQQKGRAKAAKA